MVNIRMIIITVATKIPIGENNFEIPESPAKAFVVVLYSVEFAVCVDLIFPRTNAENEITKMIRPKTKTRDIIPPNSDFPFLYILPLLLLTSKDNRY